MLFLLTIAAASEDLLTELPTEALVPNPKGWDLRCVGACTVQREEAVFSYTSSGGAVFLEYHGLVLTERGEGSGSVSVLQGEGRMTATWEDGTVLDRPMGPQIRLLVDPNIPEASLGPRRDALKVMPFEEVAAPADSTTMIRYKPGYKGMAESIGERIGAPFESGAVESAHIEVTLGSNTPTRALEGVEVVEVMDATPATPKSGLCGCTSSPRSGFGWLLLLTASCFVRRGAGRNG
jgi:hypothetical protein